MPLPPPGSEGGCEMGAWAAWLEEFDWDELGRSGPPGAPGAGLAWAVRLAYDRDAFIRLGEACMLAGEGVLVFGIPGADLDSPVSTRFRGLWSPAVSGLGCSSSARSRFPLTFTLMGSDAVAPAAEVELASIICRSCCFRCARAFSFSKSEFR